MNKEQILQDESLLKRFTRDYKVPITIFIPELFEERLEVLGYFKPDLENTWNYFIEMMKGFEYTQGYFEVYNEMKDLMISFIKESEGYKRFNESEDMNNFQVVEPIRRMNLPSKDIFKPSYAGKVFRSFDMRQANFHALQHYSRDMFRDRGNWEEFVMDFVPKEMEYYMMNSKYLREVVLGNCNPKRHITYEKFLMSLILKDLLEMMPDMKDRIVFFSNDEVIFEEPVSWEININRFFTYNYLELPFKMERFKLHSLGDNIGYVKEHLDEELFREHPFAKFETKSVNNFCMPFVLRKLLGQNITDNDRLFIHPNESLLSKFVEIPDIQISEDLQKSLDKAKNQL